MTAEFILAALGTKEFEDPEQYEYAVTGAMILAEGLLELQKIRNIMVKALKG